MIRGNTDSTSSSSEESLLGRSKLEDRQLLTQIRHHPLDQRLLRGETVLPQTPTPLSRRLRSASQPSQSREPLVPAIGLTESNLAELDLFEEYNLQDLSAQRPSPLSPNTDRYRRPTQNTRRSPSAQIKHLINC